MGAKATSDHSSAPPLCVVCIKLLPSLVSIHHSVLLGARKKHYLYSSTKCNCSSLEYLPLKTLRFTCIPFTVPVLNDTHLYNCNSSVFKWLSDGEHQHTPKGSPPGFCVAHGFCRHRFQFTLFIFVMKFLRSDTQSVFL